MSNITLYHRQLLPVRFELSRPVLKDEVSHVSDNRSLENGNMGQFLYIFYIKYISDFELYPKYYWYKVSPGITQL